MGISISAIVTAGLVATSTVVGLPANAAVSPTESSASQYESVLSFDKGISLQDAETVLAEQAIPAIGLQIDNGTILGAYYIGRGQTELEFQSKFEQLFGTQPRVTGIIQERQNSEPTQPSKIASFSSVAETALPNSDVIETGKAEFIPAAVPAEKVVELKAQHTNSAPSRLSRGLAWAPEQVYSETYRSGLHQYFNMSISWYSASPANIASYFGLEAQIDLDNGATGTRQVVNTECASGYKDAFIAKNHDWYSWFAWADGGSISGVNPYPDYNDLFDSCGRNSIALGFQHPQLIPYNSVDGGTLNTYIDAPIGTSSASLVSGTIQQVDNGNCSAWWGALTDCMGTLQYVGAERVTLNKSRLWYASPNIGWLSNASGSATPIRYY